MKIRLQIYNSKAAASRDDRELVSTKIIDVESNKKLTADRAAKIIKRELPVFDSGAEVIVIKTENGWEASRTLEPSEKCDYHYAWEYAVVSEWED